MSKPTVTVDTDALVKALARSTNMAKALEKTAEQIGQRAIAVAKVEAYDEGDYAEGFTAFAISANAIKSWISSAAGREYRSRRRKAGAYSPVIEGEYNGAVGVIANNDYKAYWVEYGTIRTPPKAVLQRSALEFGGDVGGKQ